MTAAADTLRIGVIGVGLLGERHARFWAQQPDVDLIAVADARPEHADAVAQKWGVPKSYASADDLIASERLDAVSIATPDFAHREPTVAALTAGIHVLVEKPLALTSEDARAMITAAEQSGRLLMVNHSMRWIPQFAHLKQAIQKGELGDVIAAHSVKADTVYVPTEMLSWAAGSTPAYFLTPHDLDLVRWWMDDEVAEVYAQAVGRVLRGRGIDTPDVVQASVRFRNGAIGTFESSWILPNTFPSLTDNYMHVIGSRGTVFFDRGRETTETFTEHGVSYPKLSTVYEHNGRIYGSFRHALEHFTECVRSGSEPLTSATRVYGVVSALEAIHRSIASRQPERVDALPGVGRRAQG